MAQRGGVPVAPPCGSERFPTCTSSCCTTCICTRHCAVLLSSSVCSMFRCLGGRGKHTRRRLAWEHTHTPLADVRAYVRVRACVCVRVCRGRTNTRTHKVKHRTPKRVSPCLFSGSTLAAPKLPQSTAQWRVDRDESASVATFTKCSRCINVH